MRDRQKEIRNKGFCMTSNEPPKNVNPAEYAKMKIGLKTLDDAVMDLGSFKKADGNYGDKDFILSAIGRRDYQTLRNISNYFYEISGIYRDICRYLAFLYRYDWFVTPYLIDNKLNNNKVLNDFAKVLNYLDNSSLKKLFGNVSLEIFKYGVYYGCIVDLGNSFTLQQLPANYCRSRFSRGINPVVELNMRFFDSYFNDPQYRLKVLKMFPKDIQHGYILYKEGKLQGDYPGDKNGWYMLDPSMSVKFGLNNDNFPPLVGAIPSIIDLDAAQELDRKKTMQQLLKIVIQKLPLDKNGDLIFDVDEARSIHNNATAMLSRAIGVDVLTTFADIDVANMQDKNSTTASDDLMKVERTVYNNLGISQNLFNTEGNIALEKSIANDEASVKDLIYQYQDLLNRIVKKFNKNSHYEFKVSILETTIYNFKEMSKIYKEQTQIGYSKMLPQIALGHSQSSIIATAQFENKILHLSDIMIPPMMSSTMSGKMQEKASDGEKKVGRPEKPNEEKTEKTIKNRQAIG